MPRGARCDEGGARRRRSAGVAVLAALLMLLLLALLAMASLRPGTSVDDLALARGGDLAFARDALIDYAVNYPSHYGDRGAGPGHLPCPDRDGDGSPQLHCNGLAIGLLPADFLAGGRRQVGFVRRQQAAAEPLWYVVSSAFRYSPAPSGFVGHATVVNSDTRGDIYLDGVPVVALLVAPGEALDGQDRTDVASAGDYLEAENADGDRHFSSSAGNDRVLALRLEELLPLVERRVLAEVLARLEDYRSEHGRLPWLSPLGSSLDAGDSACQVCTRRGWLATPRYRRGSWPAAAVQACAGESGDVPQPTVALPAWLVRNFWHRLLWVGHAQSGDDCPAAEALTLDGVAVGALAVSVGTAQQHPLHGGGEQRRGPGATASQYLDHPSWVDGDAHFLSTPPSPGVNDQWGALP